MTRKSRNYHIYRSVSDSPNTNESGEGVRSVRSISDSYSYSPVGKQTLVSYPNGSQASSFYDGVGNRVLAVDTTGRYTRTYDPLDRTIVSVQPHGGRLTFVWDAVGQRRLMIDLAGGRTTYVHDANGHITRLTNPQSDLTTFTYDGAGQRTRTDLANSTWNVNVYDTAGRVTQLSQFDAGSGIQRWSTLTTDQWAALTVDQWSALAVDALETSRQSYRYDKASRKTSRIDLTGNRSTISMLTTDDWASLTVDQWSALAVDALETSRLTYHYDPANRKTVRTDLSGNRVTWSYDTAGQLIGEIQTGPTPQSATWTYDPAGNRLTQHKSGETTTYVPNAANQILTATDLSGTTTYKYDAAGNQQSGEKKVSGTNSRQAALELLRLSQTKGARQRCHPPPLRKPQS